MLEFYEPQADYGTPKSTSTTMVTLSIDGVSVTVPEGTSVMRAAAESGVKIPRLCATDQLKSFRLSCVMLGRNRRPPRLSRVLHHERRSGHGSQQPSPMQSASCAAT